MAAITTLHSEQWVGGMGGMKMIIATVTMNNAAAGGYVAAGEALALAAYFDTMVYAGVRIGGSAASQPYLWACTTGANTTPLITATWTGAGLSAVLADVTAATDLSAATTTWMFLGT